MVELACLIEEAKEGVESKFVKHKIELGVNSGDNNRVSMFLLFVELFSWKMEDRSGVEGVGGRGRGGGDGDDNDI